MAGNDAVIERMRSVGMEITRENFIGSKLGNPVPEWDAEYEGMLPEELQDWSLFEMRDGGLKLKKGAFPQSEEQVKTPRAAFVNLLADVLSDILNELVCV